MYLNFHLWTSKLLLQAHQARDGAVAAERRLQAQVMQQKQEVAMLKLKVEQAQAAARAARDEAHQTYGRRLQVAPASLQACWWTASWNVPVGNLAAQGFRFPGLFAPCWTDCEQTNAFLINVTALRYQQYYHC